MKDCLIISFFSKNETGFGSYYIEALESNAVSYDVLYFERYQMDRCPGENEIAFKHYCPTGGSRLKKLRTMLGYARFLRKIIRKGRYRALIVLTTMPAVMASDLLLKQYRGRFILDIRDYTHEDIGLYTHIERRLINAAYTTVISSRGFEEFLPKQRYVYTHNIAKVYTTRSTSNIGNKRIYKIGFVGSIRYFKENCALIRQLSGNERYHLVYHGTHTQGCDLERYCKEHGFENVQFGGSFDNSEKDKLYNGIDIINSIYGTEGKETTTAVPNRFYDAAIYRCPIIVSKGTYLQELVQEYNLGIAVDIHRDDVGALLDDYIRTFDKVRFEEGCDRLLEDVERDMSGYRSMLSSFVLEIGKQYQQ